MTFCYFMLDFNIIFQYKVTLNHSGKFVIPGYFNQYLAKASKQPITVSQDSNGLK